jgi:pyrroline-5-carboxylate reductase
MKIGIIGCGNMGGALARALPSEYLLLFYDQNQEKMEKLSSEGCGRACKEIDEVILDADVLILAIKPNDLKNIADVHSYKLGEDQIIVSILAGTSLADLRRYFPVGKIVRMMPNMAIMVREGIIGLCSDEVQTMEIFATLGKVIWIPEEKMDTLTSIGGSGPALFFEIIEAMIGASQTLGFSEKDSRGLIYQLIKGCLALTEQIPQHPVQLQKQISSPGGTTIEGLKVLKQSDLGKIIADAFRAAEERAFQMSLHPEKTLSG